MAEPVLMVWDIYDGVRSGIALYCGAAHYFECEFNRTSDGYTDVFGLWPVDKHLLARASENWQFYRSWEYRFHSGEVSVESHPGNRGRSARYDEIEDEIQLFLDSRGAPSHRVVAKFAAKDNQPQLPRGCLREMEVTWLGTA